MGLQATARGQNKRSFLLETHMLCYIIIGRDQDLEENHSTTNPH